MMDNVTPNFLWDLLRNVFSLLDRIVYQLLVWIYEIFFNVSKQEVFTDATIMNFFNRVFLILGVFMLFKLAFSLLNSIVNPDMLIDKEKGAGKIVTRVLTAIVLLTVLVPTNIPSPTPGSMEEKMNSHGLLFGALYSLQDRILKQNVIGKIILGSSAESNQDMNKNIENAGNNMSAVVYRAFLYPNSSCKGVSPTIASKYKNTSEPSELINLVNEECDTDDGKRYAFSYMPIISTIVGGFIVFIILGFTIDIAIRSIKLSVLRLMAPIPVISYIDPKSAKDGAFSAWTKNLISTYLDLFLRLIIIYFAVFVVVELTKNPPKIEGDNVVIESLVLVFMVVGVFFFAKQAPKFIKDVLGVKGGGSSNIGLAGLMGGAGALLAGGGIAAAGASMLGSANAAAEAAGTGKQYSGAWSSGRDLGTQIRTGDKNAKGGFMNNAQRNLMNRADDRAVRLAENRAAQMGLTKENMDAQKSLIKNADADYNNARFDYEQLSAQYSNYNLANDPGEFTAAEPQLADYNNDLAKYSADHSKWQQDKTSYDKQLEEYNKSKEEKRRLGEQARAAYDRMSESAERKTKLERNLADAKEARGGLGPKEKKYTARKPFRPGE